MKEESYNYHPIRELVDFNCDIEQRLSSVKDQIEKSSSTIQVKSLFYQSSAE